MTSSPDDSQAAELLAHAAWIRRLALGLVGDAAGAEDLVQETWLAALKRRPSTDLPLKPWLGTVLRNAARQAFRGGARRAKREAEARVGEPVPGPEELAERLELERALTDELARLAEPFRSTLMLRYYAGLEPAEIARRQHLPPGTVRWRAMRGLELLRERLDGRFGGRPQWSVLFLSFARPIAAPVTTGAATAGAATGALAMHAMTKLGIGAAAAVALAVGLRLGGLWPDSLWPQRREEPARVSIRPLAPEASEEPRVVVEESAHAAERREVPAEVAESSEAEPAPAGFAPADVEARVVDTLGAAVSGARLRVLDGEASDVSDPEGRLGLELPLAVESRTVTFALGARGFGSLQVEAVVRAGRPTHLGTLVLPYGGVVSGLVREPDGRPVADALVTFGGVDLPRRELEEQRLRPPGSRVPSARTRADGTFSVEGVAAGLARVWAHAPGHLATFSAPLDVQAGHESYGLELVLEPVPAGHHVAGIVLDPDGNPVAHAQLYFRHRSEKSGNVVSGDRKAGPDGRFEFLLPGDAELWLTARDPEQRHGPASVSAVRTGSPPLVLQLTRSGSFELVVTDARGEPATRYAVSVLSPDESFEHQSLERAERPDGRAELRLPSEPFALRVDAPGHEIATVGPLDPAALSGPVTARLVALPGLRGVVTAGGEPVAGASVGLQPVVPEKRDYVKDGFRALLENAVETATTDEDGRFLLTPREARAYVVRAEKAGLAPAVSAAIEVGPSLDGGELALALTPGGAIEGEVRALDGADPAGTIVGLSRGDGHDRTLRVGPDGRYRFEHLTPGPWLLVRRDEEIRPDSSSTSTREGGRRMPDIEWTCQVREGQTTRHDLVLEAADACALEGRFTIRDRAPATWSAMLIPEQEFFAQAEGGKLEPLGAGGTFRVSAAQPGRYQLVLAGHHEEGGEQYVIDLVDLDWGVREWELELELGMLEIEGAPAWDGEGPPAVVHVWDGPGERMAVTVIAGDGAGATRVAVPAGKGRLVAPDPKSLDVASWPTRAEVEVPRVGEARVALGR